MASDINKIVLSYSGGLDTTVIAKWLQETYSAEVVTFTADIGQGEEVEPARAKAAALGIREIYIEDLTEEFVRDYVFPMFRANTIYEGEYLLGTSIARPLIVKRLVEIARETGADAIAHGCTGKGNDQVRFEVGANALDPKLQVIAPWRDWDLTSRESLMAYCESRQIAVEYTVEGKKSPYSMDANLLHISYEGDVLEDPWQEAEEAMWRWTVAPENAPDEPEDLVIAFEKGDPVAINGEALGPAALLARLNEIGGRHGIGRLDIVENRYVGMKSRGCYETPGGTILLPAHRAIESITLDREVAHLKDEVMPKYAHLIYNGYWFSPERRALQALIDESQQYVTGEVRLKLYKGSVKVTGRRSEHSLFDEKVATFEEDEGAYDQADAAGFIRLNSLRLRIAAARAARWSDPRRIDAGTGGSGAEQSERGSERDADMADDYEVVFSGQVYKDEPVHEVKKRLAKMFDQDMRRIDRLFAGGETVIRSGMSRDVAEKYQLALAKVGAIAQVRSESGAADYDVADRSDTGAISAVRMTCPKCATEQLMADHCARCGVNIAKAEAELREKEKIDRIIEMKVAALRKPYKGEQPAVTVNPTTGEIQLPQFVGLGPRLAAAVFDVLFLFFVLMPATLLAAPLLGGAFPLDALLAADGFDGVVAALASDFAFGIGQVVFLVVGSMAVLLFFWFFRSATPGLMLAGARIVDTDFEQPSMLACLTRSIVAPVSLLLLAVGGLWLAFDSRRRTWHDIAAGTYVVAVD